MLQAAPNFSTEFCASEQSDYAQSSSTDSYAEPTHIAIERISLVQTDPMTHDAPDDPLESETRSHNDPEAAYRFHDNDGRTVAASLDELARGAEDPQEIAFSYVHAGEGARERSRDHMVSRALSYELTEDARGRNKVTLEPAGLGDTSGLSPLSAAAAPARQLWEAIAAEVRHPMLVSHFADLRFSLGQTSGVDAARALIDAYLGSDAGHDLHSVLGLMRANYLARTMKIADREMVVRDRILRRAESPLTKDSVWVLTRILDVLADSPRTSTSDPDRLRIRGIIDRGWIMCEAQPWLADGLAHADRRFAASDAERREAERRHVAMCRAVALEDSGFRRLMTLTRAAHIAGRYGLIPERDEIIVLLQELDPDALQAQRFTRTLSLPTWMSAPRLRPYRRATSWAEALDLWLDTGAPTGSAVANARYGEQHTKGFLSRVTRVSLGVHSLPEKTTSGEDAAVLQTTQSERIQAQHASGVLADALDLIAERFPDINEESILTHLSKYNADEVILRRFSHAVALFFAGNYNDAGVIATPLAEAAARGLLRQLHHPMYRLEDGNASGHFPALDTYLEALVQHHLDEDWSRALRITLTPEGFDFRNRVAHGFKTEFSRGESALVLRVTGMLALLTSPDSSIQDADDAAARIRFPVTSKAKRRWRLMRI